MKKAFYLLLPALALFWGCDPKDDLITNPSAPQVTDEQFAQNFGSEAQRDFIGQIVDTNDAPIAGATVKIGAATTQTDANGVFMLNGANVYAKFAYITATKIGYVDGSRALVPTEGKNNVRIMLLPAAATQIVHSGESASVDLANGTKVDFDGAFADAAGAVYAGDVNVSLYHLESSNENLPNLMPGMLYAKSASGQPVGLETFGMLHVQLTGSGGQRLQIAPGHTAKITMKIDDAQSATAPQSIPLWHFDEVNGYWKQEGSATRQGSAYVGNVSHFSWWNCDMFNSAVILTVTVSSNGVPLSHAGVSLTVDSNNFNSTVEITDNNGQISGLVPANETLTVTIYNTCGAAVYTAPIGPFSQNSVLPIDLVSTDEAHVSKIKGSFVQCDGAPIDQGYVLFSLGYKKVIADASGGDFEMSVMGCSANAIFELEGVDATNGQSTGKISYHFNYPQTDIGTLKSCNTASEFIFYQTDDNAPVYFTPPISVRTDGQFGILTNHPPNGLFALYGLQTTYVPGDYHSDQFQLETWTTPFSVYILHETPNSMVYHINKFGAVGQYIDITFEGDYGEANYVHHVKGILHLLRDN